MPSAWSYIEVEAIVADYMLMLESELKREPYNKAAHRRALSQMLSDRPPGAIERKHQNISAILIELGYPYISGYKPLGNYQKLLRDVTADRVASDRHLAAVVHAAMTAPANVPHVAAILDRLEKPPEPAALKYSTGKIGESKVAKPPVNYLEKEALNASLGLAGEKFAVAFEQARLIHAGYEGLADQVEHVAVTQGDGLGYDIRSYETSGKDRFIEVKTTGSGKQTPFFVTLNEVAVSRDLDRRYHLYRLFDFRDDPRLFTVAGSIERACLLEPITFSARIRG